MEENHYVPGGVYGTPVVLEEAKDQHREEELYQKLFYKQEEIEIGEKLGEGNFAATFCGRIKDLGISVALKVAKASVDDESIHVEISNFSKIGKHRNVLRYIGFVMLVDKPCYMTELCSYGNLHDLHDSERFDKEANFLRVATDICCGLAHLHAKGVVHRDIACRNLLMRKDGSVLIADYGLARVVGTGDEAYYTAGKAPTAWPWMAPESFTYLDSKIKLVKGKFTKKSDVYMLGVAFWEMLTRGKRPYEESTGGVSSARIGAREASERIRLGLLKLSTPKNATVIQKTIVEACLAFDPEERPSAMGVLSNVLYINPTQEQLSEWKESLVRRRRRKKMFKLDDKVHYYSPVKGEYVKTRRKIVEINYDRQEVRLDRMVGMLRFDQISHQPPPHDKEVKDLRGRERKIDYNQKYCGNGNDYTKEDGSSPIKVASLSNGATKTKDRNCQRNILPPHSPVLIKYEDEKVEKERTETNFVPKVGDYVFFFSAALKRMSKIRRQVTKVDLNMRIAWLKGMKNRNPLSFDQLAPNNNL